MVGLVLVSGGSARLLSQAQGMSAWVPPFVYTTRLETQLPSLFQLCHLMLRHQLDTGRCGDWEWQTGPRAPLPRSYLGDSHRHIDYPLPVPKGEGEQACHPGEHLISLPYCPFSDLEPQQS